MRKSLVEIEIVLFTTANLAGRGTFELHSPTRRNGMTMTVCLAEEKGRAGALVKFAPVELLLQRKTEIHNMIARRAYELFERRGRVPSHEMDDWVQAESELVYPCCRDLKESAEAIILHVDLPGSLTADQLTVSVEPRRLLVSGEKEISLLYGNASDAHWKVRLQRIFRLYDLPENVDRLKQRRHSRAMRLTLCYRKRLSLMRAAKENSQHHREDSFETPLPAGNLVSALGG